MAKHTALHPFSPIPPILMISIIMPTRLQRLLVHFSHEKFPYPISIYRLIMHFTVPNKQQGIQAALHSEFRLSRRKPASPQFMVQLGWWIPKVHITTVAPEKPTDPQQPLMSPRVFCAFPLGSIPPSENDDQSVRIWVQTWMRLSSWYCE